MTHDEWRVILYRAAVQEIDSGRWLSFLKNATERSLRAFHDAIVEMYGVDRATYGLRLFQRSRWRTEAEYLGEALLPDEADACSQILRSWQEAEVQMPEKPEVNRRVLRKEFKRALAEHGFPLEVDEGDYCIEENREDATILTLVSWGSAVSSASMGQLVTKQDVVPSLRRSTSMYDYFGLLGIIPGHLQLDDIPPGDEKRAADWMIMSMKEYRRVVFEAAKQREAPPRVA